VVWGARARTRRCKHLQPGSGTERGGTRRSGLGHERYVPRVRVVLAAERPVREAYDSRTTLST